MSTARIPSLDGLRALAITLVLFCHFMDDPGHLSKITGRIVGSYGHAGVRTFFVISGFLITTLLLRERERSGRIEVKNFYIRRAYRILPVAYLYIIVMTAVFFSTLSAKDIAVAFTYATAYVNQRPYVLTHLWSLSVEEQFYLVWPVIMAISVALGRRMVIGVVAMAPMFRLVMLTANLGQSRFLPMSVDALAAGCLLALLQPELVNLPFFAWRWFWQVWLVTLAIPLLGPGGRLYQCVLMPLFDIGMALCLQNAITVRYRVLDAAVPVWIGTVSYSLYLWHMPFSDLARRVWYTSFPVNILLSFLVAAISYYAVERPVLRFRDRQSKPRSLLANPHLENA